MITPVPAVSGVSPTLAAGSFEPIGPTPPTAGASFATELGGAVDQVQALQGTSNELAISAVTGDLTDLHAATLASTRASVALEFASTIRNRGVEAFNEIMRMQA